MSTTSWLAAEWPAPANIHAGTSLRTNGASSGTYASFNLALHVDDNPDTVMLNRQQLKENLAYPKEPLWLEQVHSTVVVNADTATGVPQADASFSDQVGTVCVVMTADCLPVLFTDRQGSMVAAAHAGWRGLADGILEQTVQQANFMAEDTLVWFGPGIGADVYEVGEDVRQVFIQQAMHDETAFTSRREGKYLMDMYALARQRLTALGITEIYGGDRCTYSQAEQFYSYRRDGVTGRMASLIWIES